MGESVTLPWAVFVGLALLAAWAVGEHLLLPPLRWFFERRSNRVLRELNARLHLKIQPFKLTRRQSLVDRLLFDAKVLEAAEQHAAEHGLRQAVVMAQVRRYAEEIVPAFSAYVYFRIGYAPTHYTSENCWKARELIEASSAVSVPSVTVQLANMKKLQHTLSDPATLRRFVTDAEARQLERSFVRFARLEDEIEWKGQRGKARDLAIAFPDDWVMKPHREGGANNFFGDEMVAELKKSSVEESEAFILMEMIQQEPFRAIRLVNGEVEDGPCFTELGVFGIYLAPAANAAPVVNREGGYLLRTKNVANKEGLVLGGFSFMDSVSTP